MHDVLNVCTAVLRNVFAMRCVSRLHRITSLVLKIKFFKLLPSSVVAAAVYLEDCAIITMYKCRIMSLWSRYHVAEQYPVWNKNVGGFQMLIKLHKQIASNLFAAINETYVRTNKVPVGVA